MGVLWDHTVAGKEGSRSGQRLKSICDVLLRDASANDGELCRRDDPSELSHLEVREHNTGDGQSVDTGCPGKGQDLVQGSPLQLRRSLK